MAYIDSSTSLEAWNSAKGQIVEELSLPETDLVVFHRKITGDGIHDAPEVINYDASIRKMDVISSRTRKVQQLQTVLRGIFHFTQHSLMVC